MVDPDARRLTCMQQVMLQPSMSGAGRGARENYPFV